LKIKFSSTAESDLDAIRSYIAKDSSVAAERIVARILQAIIYLQDFPKLGRPGIVPDTRELNILGLPPDEPSPAGSASTAHPFGLRPPHETASVPESIVRPVRLLACGPASTMPEGEHAPRK
jgi:hypothetical protein